MPSELKYLNCTGSYKLESLDNLPDSIIKLIADYTTIKRIESLPKSLRNLSLQFCYDLEYIREFPENIRCIELLEAQIDHLPYLPNIVTKVYIWNSHMSSITNIPPNIKFFEIYCHYLTELPEMPDGILYIDVSGGCVKAVNTNIPPSVVRYRSNTESWCVIPYRGH